MSIISNINIAIVYESKGSNKSIPQFGQRGIVTIAKADKSGNYGQHLQQTMFTSVPQLSAVDIDFKNISIQNAVVSYFETVQNAIVSDNLKSGNKSVTNEQLGIDNIIAFLETVNSPEKWDAAKIASWFQTTLAEIIGVALIERGFTDTQLEKSLVAYSTLFSETFSSKSVIPNKKAIAIQKALLLTVGSEVEHDSQVVKFKARIDKSLEEKNIDELLGL